MGKEKNKPEWFKLWGFELSEMIDVESIPLYKEGDQMFIYEDIGRAFIDALLYLNDSNEEGVYFNTLEGRYINKSLKKSIDSARSDYERRAEINRINGGKGGRPTVIPFDEGKEGCG